MHDAHTSHAQQARAAKHFARKFYQVWQAQVQQVGAWVAIARGMRVFCKRMKRERTVGVVDGFPGGNSRAVDAVHRQAWQVGDGVVVEIHPQIALHSIAALSAHCQLSTLGHRDECQGYIKQHLASKT